VASITVLPVVLSKVAGRCGRVVDPSDVNEPS
jgi:hypothetical protein